MLVTIRHEAARFAILTCAVAELMLLGVTGFVRVQMAAQEPDISIVWSTWQRRNQPISCHRRLVSAENSAGVRPTGSVVATDAKTHVAIDSNTHGAVQRLRCKPGPTT